jgi:hypothetical protein
MPPLLKMVLIEYQPDGDKQHCTEKDNLLNQDPDLNAKPDACWCKKCMIRQNNPSEIALWPNGTKLYDILLKQVSCNCA